MANKIEIGRLTNAAVYLNGNSLLGKVEEIQLPSVKPLLTEHKALGMVGKIELPSGFDKLEGKMKWTSLYPAELILVANPFAAVQLQVRGSLETWTNQGRTIQTKVVAQMQVTFKNFPLGNYKQNDSVEAETDYACSYVKLTIGTIEVTELDVFNNIFKVNGVDLLAQYRENLGG